jgi:hypothetical protein
MRKIGSDFRCQVSGFRVRGSEVQASEVQEPRRGYGFNAPSFNIIVLVLELVLEITSNRVLHASIFDLVEVQFYLMIK